MATKYIKETTIRALFHKHGKEVSPEAINVIDEATNDFINDIIKRTLPLKGRITKDVIMFILNQENEQLFDSSEL